MRRLALGIVGATLAALVSWGVLELTSGSAPVDFSGPVAGWPHYGRGPGGTRFSPLNQITPEATLAGVHDRGHS